MTDTQDRIKAMAEQAGMLEVQHLTEDLYVSSHDAEGVTPDHLAKFAALVAEDCAKLCDGLDDGPVGNFDGAERAGQAIRARHGVKEG